MIVARTSNGPYRVWCLSLLAITGVACGSGSSSSGTGGGPGSAGVSGSVGSGGSGGSVGSTGSAGTTGGAGTAGEAGTSGSAGNVGSTGTAGAGNSGNAGSMGSTGSAGASGSAGVGGSSAGRGGVTGGGGRGGSTSTAGATGTAGNAAGGRGGTTGTAGSTGTGGGAGAAMPSAGCGTATASPMSGHFTIDAAGTAREYIIKIPTGYDRNHPYRLIVAFHGRMYDAASVDAGGAPSPSGPYYGIEPLSGGSAIFVAAQALSTSWTNANDIPYVNAMIARFKTELCIDQRRIFATGFSMGAIQTIALGCAEADVFRAIAAMSGSLNGGTCSGTQPIAYWGSHGTNDPTINISNGRMVRDTFRMRNHCTTTTVAGSPAGCVNYQGCDAGYPAVWCEFDGVHEPPPYSGSAIWAFLSQF
jgi:poly(3-hydroxybutyrate) depolymerase